MIFYKSKWRRKKSKISSYNDGLIGSISSHSKRSKQKFTIWSIDFTKDQGKERTLHRKNLIHLVTCHMNQNCIHGSCSIIVYQYDRINKSSAKYCQTAGATEQGGPGGSCTPPPNIEPLTVPPNVKVAPRSLDRNNNFI